MSDLHQILRVDEEIGANLNLNKYCKNIKIQDGGRTVAILIIKNKCNDLGKRNINTTEVV